jgi:hypothetical protein
MYLLRFKELKPMKTIILISMVLTVIICSSCKKDNQIIQPQTQSFPNQVGDKWIYRLTDHNIDTVKVEIVGQGSLPDGTSAKIWKYTYQFPSQTVIDTFLVTSINNEVRMYSSNCWSCMDPMPSERFHYILPLSVGNTWFTDIDTTKVLNQESISVPAGTFTNVFQLAHLRHYVTNSWKNDTIYFKEQIGLVKLSQLENDLGPILGNGIWELISYHVQ